MKEEYAKLRNFWNGVFDAETANAVTEKFVTADKLNKIFTKCIKSDSVVLDYGCGSGWGLIEMALTAPFAKGIGIDCSANAIALAEQTAEMSNFGHLSFEVGDENNLKDKANTFDFIFSANVLDVVPDEICFGILSRWQRALKENGNLLVCLNPYFSAEQLTTMLAMEEKDGYYYKNGILRCNYKTPDEWKTLLGKYFEVADYDTFLLFDQEKFRRQMFLLRKA